MRKVLIDPNHSRELREANAGLTTKHTKYTKAGREISGWMELPFSAAIRASRGRPLLSYSARKFDRWIHFRVFRVFRGPNAGLIRVD
jgi:hypothetical protein